MAFTRVIGIANNSGSHAGSSYPNPLASKYCAVFFVTGDPYQLRIYVPDGFAGEADGGVWRAHGGDGDRRSSAHG
jgi:hypothetical protein